MERPLRMSGMSVLRKFYDYMLRHPRTKRGSWGRWYYLERYAKVLEEITKYSQTSSHVLDVGCNEGLYAYYIHRKNPSCSYVGCDISKTLLITAYKDANTNYILCDARALPFRNSSAELVLCSEVLEHLRLPYHVLISLCDISSRATIITFPEEPLVRILGLRHPEHISTIDLDKIVTKLKSKGYETLKTEIIARFSIPCGILEFLRISRSRYAMIIVRLLERMLRAFVPAILIPYRVRLVVAAKANFESPVPNS